MYLISVLALHTPISWLIPSQCLAAAWIYNNKNSAESVHSLAGYLECKPNVKNPRDLDIELHYEFIGKKMSCQTTQNFKMR